jgi:hypothetical protein
MVAENVINHLVHKKHNNATILRSTALQVLEIQCLRPIRASTFLFSQLFTFFYSVAYPL